MLHYQVDVHSLTLDLEMIRNNYLGTLYTMGKAMLLESCKI